MSGKEFSNLRNLHPFQGQSKICLTTKIIKRSFEISANFTLPHGSQNNGADRNKT